MKYTSTRGDGKRISSAEAIVAGLAPDGGLYLPTSLPVFSRGELQMMLRLSYPQRAARVLSQFLTDYTLEELEDYTARTYNATKFGGNTPAPVRPLTEHANVLELYHGPTCAFKDFALQMLPLLLTGALKKIGETRTIVILTATSGDTGKAALEGFAGVDGTRIAVFYPEGGTSPIQRLQMTTQTGDNVMVYAVKGNFDDAQNGVKKIFSDAAFHQQVSDKGYLLSSANSINWGRLAPQIAYYVSGYCDLVSQERIAMGDPINVVVPTGNFGNILACYIAKCCGLPIGRLICASNENNVLTEFLKTGIYNRNRRFYTTASPSMDILVSSNLERLLYLMCNGNCKKVSGYMQKLNETGTYQIDDEMLARIHNEFSAGYADDEATLEMIHTMNSKYNYLMDTHTAVAFDVYRQYVQETGDPSTTLLVSTASPFKFPASVLNALGQSTSGDDFHQLDRLCEISGLQAPESLSTLRAKTERFTTVIPPEDMKVSIASWLNI